LLNYRVGSGKLMNFEQFFRRSLNAYSKKIPGSLQEAVETPEVRGEYGLFHGGTLKHRLAGLNSFCQEVLGDVPGELASESFSLMPVTEEQEDQIEECVRDFYEGAGYSFDKKDIAGLSDTYFFKNSSRDSVVVTVTLPLWNEREPLRVSVSNIQG
jgi:hypothetical protein